MHPETTHSIAGLFIGGIAGIMLGVYLGIRISATSITERAIKRKMWKELHMILMPEVQWASRAAGGAQVGGGRA